MPRKKSEHIININGETLKMREGESRRVTMPVLLRLEGGVLHITQPDVIMSREGQEQPISYAEGYFQKTAEGG